MDAPRPRNHPRAALINLTGALRVVCGCVGWWASACLGQQEQRKIPDEPGFPRQEVSAPAPEGASFLPPPFRALRFQEDDSYLADPAKRVDAFDPIKYIRLNAADPSYYLSLGGEFRERYECTQNPGFGVRVAHDGELLQRIALSADLHLGSYLRIYAEGISGLQFFEQIPLPVQDDRADLQMAFADLRSSPSENGFFLLRAGRQEMIYGSGRLIATRPVLNIPTKFDGFTARAHSGDSTLSAFLVRPVKPDSRHFDGEDDTATFWGVYGESHLPHLPAVKVDAYYLGLRREQSRFAGGTGTEHNHTFGLRISGTQGAWSYDEEADLQTGTIGSHSIGAWAVSTDNGYTLREVCWTPRLGLKADVASGETNKNDRTMETFDPLFFNLGYFNEAKLYRPSNLMDLHPSIRASPRPGVVLSLASDVLWRYTVNDGIYSPLGPVALQPNGHSSHYVGATLEGSAEWKINRHLTLSAAYVHFFGGSYVRESKGTCLREAPISEAQARLIESGIGIVLILDKAEGDVIVGLLTLHDLLRAQDALARQADTP